MTIQELENMGLATLIDKCGYEHTEPAETNGDKLTGTFALSIDTAGQWHAGYQATNRDGQLVWINSGLNASEAPIGNGATPVEAVARLLALKRQLDISNVEESRN